MRGNYGLIIVLVLFIVGLAVYNNSSVTVIVPEDTKPSYGVMDVITSSREIGTAEAETRFNPYVIITFMLIPIIIFTGLGVYLSLGTEYMKQKRLLYGKRKKGKGFNLSRISVHDRMRRKRSGNE